MILSFKAAISRKYCIFTHTVLKYRLRREHPNIGYDASMYDSDNYTSTAPLTTTVVLVCAGPATTWTC